jgi:hypothetical protein
MICLDLLQVTRYLSLLAHTYLIVLVSPLAGPRGGPACFGGTAPGGRRGGTELPHVPINFPPPQVLTVAV